MQTDCHNATYMRCPQPLSLEGGYEPVAGRGQKARNASCRVRACVRAWDVTRRGAHAVGRARKKPGLNGNLKVDRRHGLCVIAPSFLSTMTPPYRLPSSAFPWPPALLKQPASSSLLHMSAMRKVLLGYAGHLGRRTCILLPLRRRR